MNPSVITSRTAQKDFEKIKANHADIVSGIAMQAQKNEMLGQQKQVELAQQNSMKMEMDKAKMVSDTQSQKNAMDFATKQAEIDIKRASLSSA